MITIIIIISIILIALLLLGYQVWQLKRELKQLTRMAIAPSSLEQDLEYLLFVINLKMTKYEEFIIKPARLNKSAMISNEDYKKYSEEIIVEVYDSLSPQYLNLLYRYITPDALLTMISEIILQLFTKKCLHSNLNALKKGIFENKVVRKPF